MKKTLLSLIAVVALVGGLHAQTTYLDFEGKTPVYGTFGGSNFSVVANPHQTGVNTTAHVGMTQKTGTDIQVWGGVSFPVGGTFKFAPGTQTFTMDVWCAVAGTAMFKVENGPNNIENPVAYSTPGEWQTLTFTYDNYTADWIQIVIFMGFGNTNTDVWYYDNIKGPAFSPGAIVNATFNLTDLGGTVSSSQVELSSNPGIRHSLDGTQGVGTVWTKTLTGVAGSTISAPITYTMYVNGVAVPEITALPFVAAGSAPTTFAKNYGSAPAGVNLIYNGTFDNMEGVIGGRTGNLWGTYSGNGGAASVVQGVVEVTPVASGDNWQMQLEQQNFGIENAKTYKASFDAWSTAGRVISLTIEDPANGYALLGTTTDTRGTLIDNVLRSKWNVDITTTKTRYDLILTVDGMKGNSTPKLAFLMAQTTDKVFIDNVSLMETAGNVSVPEYNKANAVNFYPNPAENNLYITAKTKVSKADVYNVVGSKVKQFNNVNESIDISDLKSGVYVIRVTDEKGKTFTSKFLKK